MLTRSEVSQIVHYAPAALASYTLTSVTQQAATSDFGETTSCQTDRRDPLVRAGLHLEPSSDIHAHRTRQHRRVPRAAAS
jgi:hypothetical protein